jgi:hypothetical protein
MGLNWVLRTCQGLRNCWEVNMAYVEVAYLIIENIHVQSFYYIVS